MTPLTTLFITQTYKLNSVLDVIRQFGCLQAHTRLNAGDVAAAVASDLSQVRLAAYRCEVLAAHIWCAGARQISSFWLSSRAEICPHTCRL